jgi:hypothetical protein
LSIKSAELDFCKGAPTDDEHYYYCGFYFGFDRLLFDRGTVFTKLVKINNLNLDKGSR